ncbi:MAG: hypothetical protein MAG795_00694 [Candidatus Woesearchaeota archaeon]|nr:hypothetical protein [Candidatus Woesearchaeota archaeon]
MKKLNARQKLVAQLAGAVIVGGVIVGGVNYAINNSDNALAKPAMALETKLIGVEPGNYVDVATAYIAQNPQDMEQYAENLTTFLYAANEADLLTEDAKTYFFTDAAQDIPADLAGRVCSENVLPRISEEQQLEYVMAGMMELDSKEYGPLLKQMGISLKDDVLEDIKGWWESYGN